MTLHFTLRKPGPTVNKEMITTQLNTNRYYIILPLTRRGNRGSEKYAEILRKKWNSQQRCRKPTRRKFPIGSLSSGERNRDGTSSRGMQVVEQFRNSMERMGPEPEGLKSKSEFCSQKHGK